MFMKIDAHSQSDIQRILKFRNIAVVGMSKNEEKPAHFVPRYLFDHAAADFIPEGVDLEILILVAFLHSTGILRGIPCLQK